MHVFHPAAVKLMEVMIIVKSIECLGFLVAIVVLFQAPTFGQTLSAEATFEAASVKRSDPAHINLPPNVCRGGPGSSDPVMLMCTNAALGVFVSIAYDLQFYELIAPDWMKLGGAESGYDLTAKIAAGVAKEQYRIMLRNLLVERFHLTVHRETRNVPRYAVAPGKGPARLQDPIAKPPGGRAYGMQFAEGHIRFEGYRLSLKQFAEFLTTMLSGPVTDETNIRATTASHSNLRPTIVGLATRLIGPARRKANRRQISSRRFRINLA
jgi:uncharacterized protein (TIGR03435 family)